MYMPPNNGGDFTPPPAGTHLAVCYRLIDLGTQLQEYQGQTKTQRKIMLSWELSEERMDDGKPFMVSQRYTYSSHEKSTLRQHLEAWRGARFKDSDFGVGGFDIRNILGKGCLLSIIHTEKDGKTYANISSLSKLPKGMTAPSPENEIVYLSLEPGEFKREVFEALSEGVKNIIRKSPEFALVAGGARPAYDDAPLPDNYPGDNGGHHDASFDDPIPF